MQNSDPGPPAEAAPDLWRGDPRYPKLLDTIPDPPRGLYLRGDPGFLLRPQLAIVGARRASAAGLRAAAELAAEATRAGLTVCSGLAAGIDGAAHRAALDAGGATVAVMGTGIDTVYPAAHRGLAADVAARGCLVTEFPPGTPPLSGNFPKRNRIISGLSLGVVVVEAAVRSGSLITAGAALEQGREVFALPWSNGHGGGAGCLRLLREGAKMVQTIDDVLEELGSLYRLQCGSASAGPEAALAAEASLSPLLDLIGDEEVTVDRLAECSGLSSAQVLEELSGLELEGLVIRGPAGYLRR